MKRPLKIFFTGCGAVLFIIIALLIPILYKFYQGSKPEAKFIRVFYSYPSNNISELKIKEYDSFVDTHSVFTFKCTPDNFKKMKMIRWKKESGENWRSKEIYEKALSGTIKEFNIKPTKEFEYELFSSDKNPMFVYLGYDKKNELVFGLAISFWDKVPESQIIKNK